MHNDSAAENGPYTPQMAMAVSINTAYADLWHTVAGAGGTNVVEMAQEFGVNTDTRRHHRGSRRWGTRRASRSARPR